MLFPSPDVAQRIMEERARDGLRKAETRRLLLEAGIDRRGRLSRWTYRLVAGLGCLLVSLGRRLQRLEESPRPAPGPARRTSGASPGM
jgi:hypothetical protein